MINELVEELFDDLRLDIPIVNLLLLELVPCVPIRLNIILRQILREPVRDEKLLVLAELRELVFLLDHFITI